MELLMCECLVARRQLFCSRKYGFIEGEGSSKKVNKPNLPKLAGKVCTWAWMWPFWKKGL